MTTSTAIHSPTGKKRRLKGSGITDNAHSLAKQWVWLKNQLRKPAKVRIMRVELAKLSRMDAGVASPAHPPLTYCRPKAQGVVLDIWRSSILLRDIDEGPYPLYVTSSGLAQKPHPSWQSDKSIPPPRRSWVKTLARFDWATKTLCLQACDVQGQPRFTENIAISALQVK